MYEDLKGKTALIVGAGKQSGIGYGVARELAANGTHLFIADLGRADGGNQAATGSTVEMEALCGELEQDFSIRARPVQVDVTSPDSVQRMLDSITRDQDTLDILCNSAGASFGVPNAVHTYPEAAWLKTIDVNLHGAFRVSRAVVPLMQGRPASIVNIASRAGKTPPLFNGAYATAKAGLIMMTKVMARELAGESVRCNAVCPGVIDTDLTRWRFELEAGFFQSTPEEREAAMCQTIPLGRVGSIAEVGRLIAFLASEASSYITGQALNITGGQLMEL